jgi:signal transduction histidine kinase/CheY-like chemotaxis protein
MTNILTLELRFESDVVLTRQRTRQLAELLGYKSHEQTGIATAVSEIARNAIQYAGGGKVEFLVEGESPQIFLIRIRDKGPGIANLQAILDGRYISSTGMGLGIIGAKRLTDKFDIESNLGVGSTVLLGKRLPKQTPIVTGHYLAQITQELVQRKPDNIFEEMQRQNQELLSTLEELRARQAEVEQLNRELEETNRGVVALYAELDDKAEYLQRASKLKSHFLSDMSHEFRTPLNSILSLSRLLLDRTDGDLTPEQEKQVTFIRKSTEVLSELVNNLLDLAKIEAGKIVVQPTEFSVADIFSALRGMFRPLVTSDAVTLIFEEPIEFPTLYTDEGKVSQILRNFISNAVKFTERGEVRISATMGSGNTVVFSIADTGLGIAVEDQERIFEEFIQLEGPAQKRFKGTGLGLPLCRKLAELLGGSVSVKSEADVGSTFFATIPLIYSPPVEELVLPEISWILDPTRTPVLVVEDNLETLFIYEKYLQKSAFQVIPARTLDEARRALWDIRPRAVILDVLLDGESTWAFISDIKTHSLTRHIPVIVLTVIDNRQKAIALGADEFCVKPVEREWLVSKLTTLMNPKPLEKILLIDDDPAARYLLKGLLADKGYTIIEAPTGHEGSRKAREENPQLIFLDLVMPDTTGFKVIEELKSDPATQDIPVIISTSKDLEPQERTYLSQKALAIISKEPRSREAMLTLIEEVLTKIKN